MPLLVKKIGLPFKADSGLESRFLLCFMLFDLLQEANLQRIKRCIYCETGSILVQNALSQKLVIFRFNIRWASRRVIRLYGLDILILFLEAPTRHFCFNILIIEVKL